MTPSNDEPPNDHQGDPETSGPNGPKRKDLRREETTDSYRESEIRSKDWDLSFDDQRLHDGAPRSHPSSATQADGSEATEAFERDRSEQDQPTRLFRESEVGGRADRRDPLAHPSKTLQQMSVELGMTLDPTVRPGSVGRLHNYEVQGLIGHGGMGVVARAVDETLARQVAIKVMNRKLLTSPRARERFLREARSAASINHPNVVTIHAVHEQDGTPFLVMECVDGCGLDELIKEQKSIPINDAIDIGIQIARGLQAAHDCNVIHRDVKPGNVLIQSGLRRVKLTDFGLARLIVEKSELTSLGDIVGTPSYMAPEQVEAEKVTPRTDLFSLGCILYAMIDGSSPFRGATPLASAHLIRKHDPPRLSIKYPHVPAEYDALIADLLAKSPSKRPDSATTVVNRLQKLLAEINRQDSTFGIVESENNQQKRLKWFGLGTVMVGLVAAAVVFASMILKPDRPEPMDPQTAPAIEVLQADNAQGNEVLNSILGASAGETLDLPPGRFSMGMTLTSNLPSGLILRGGPDVVLVTEDRPALQLIDVPSLTLQDIQFETNGRQNALMIQGKCEGLQIKDCTFRTSLESSAGSSLVHFRDRVTGTAASPIVVSGCVFETNRVALVIGNVDAMEMSNQHLTLRDCDFTSRGDGRGIGLVAYGALQDLSVRDCRFQGGNVAISLQCPSSVETKRVEIERCVFYRSPVVFHFNRTNSGQDIRIRQCIGVDGHDIRHLGKRDEFLGWFDGNQAIETRSPNDSKSLRPSDSIEPPWTKGGIDLLQSLDPNDAGFLKRNDAVLNR